MKTLRDFWFGTAAGCAFVVVALLGRALDAVPTLPELIQDRLVLLLPGPVFSLLLDRFLYLGKPLLFAALLLGQVALGGLAGIVIGRLGRHAVVAAGLWLATGVVLLPLARRGLFAGSLAVALVSLLAFAAYAVAFALFAGWRPTAALRTRAQLPRTADQTSSPAGRLDRRRLLAGGALGLASVVLARRAIGKLPALPPRGRARASSDASAPAQPAAAAAAPIAGLPPTVTPADRFYVVSKNLLDPNLDAGKWRLQVAGLVAQPVTLRYSDLLAMPAIDTYRTLECISNEVGGDLISNGLWTGVPLADLLQRAGVLPGAAAVRFTSADGYTASMPLQQARDPATLLAYKLDGAPLPYKHGYPARILVTGTYGMKNPKWLTRIELASSGTAGFWQEQGWDEQGIVQTMAQIDAPDDGGHVPPGAVTIAGIAFAGARGIARVEVSTDGGGSWHDAQLVPSTGPNTWSFWQYSWQAAQPGAYTVVCRATDGKGAVQTMRRTDPFPAGSTGYHQIHLRVAA